MEMRNDTATHEIGEDTGFRDMTGERNPLDASCYDTIDFRFKGKPHQIANLIIIKHWGG